jgi:predicted phosphodiesterase
MAGDIKSYIISSDHHCPFHNTTIHKSFLRFIKDFHPDGFVLNGDFIDMFTISSHLKGVRDLEDSQGKVITLSKEFQAANEVLDAYDKVLPKDCEKYYLTGNHEDRLERFLNTDKNAVLEGLIQLEDLLRLKERKYKYISGYPNNYIKLGKLVVTHGAWTPKYASSKHLDEYRHSVVFGHTHSPQLLYVGGLYSKQVGVGLGHMADIHSKGMNYAKKTAKWVNGFAVVYVEKRTGQFWIELLNFWDNKLIHNKKVY